MPVVALGLLVAAGNGAGGLATAAVVGLVVLVLAVAGFAFGLSGERRAARLGRALANAAEAGCDGSSAGPAGRTGNAARWPSGPRRSPCCAAAGTG